MDVIPVVTLTVDVIWDVDAETAADSPAETIPAAISFGSSFSFACAVTMDLAEVIAVDVMTTAGSLSFSSACAAMAVDVTTAAADRLPFSLPGQRLTPLPLGTAIRSVTARCSTFFSFFLPAHAFQIYFIKGIPLHYLFFFLILHFLFLFPSVYNLLYVTAACFVITITHFPSKFLHILIARVIEC